MNRPPLFMLRRWLITLMIAGMLLALCACNETGVNDDNKVLILAASSTQDALAEIADMLRQRGGPVMTISPGGSNALAQQILAGSPGDLFLSADPSWADHVAQHGHAARTTPLLGGDLVLVTPTGNPAQVHQPADLLSDRVTRVALAGEHVPAGMYARQALISRGVFDPLASSGRIIRGQNVRFTLAYAERGEVQAAVVYATDAAAANVDVVFAFDSADHDPIIYPLVLLNRGRDRQAARDVYAFLQLPEAAAVFAKHGFRPLHTSEPTRVTPSE